MTILLLKSATATEQSNDNRYHVFPYGAESPYFPRPAYETDKTREFAWAEHEHRDREHQSPVLLLSSQKSKDVPSSKLATVTEQSNENRYHVFPYGAESPYIPETETRISTRVEHREDRRRRDNWENQNCM